MSVMILSRCDQIQCFLFFRRLSVMSQLGVVNIEAGVGVDMAKVRYASAVVVVVVVVVVVIVVVVVRKRRQR